MTPLVRAAQHESTFSPDQQYVYSLSAVSTGSVQVNVTPCGAPDYSRWDLLEAAVLSSDAYEDVSWAYSASFTAKLNRALQAIEDGDFKTFRTIDELINYLNDRAKKARENH